MTWHTAIVQTVHANLYQRVSNFRILTQSSRFCATSNFHVAFSTLLTLPFLRISFRLRIILQLFVVDEKFGRIAATIRASVPVLPESGSCRLDLLPEHAN